MLPEPIRDRDKIVEHLRTVLQAQIHITVTFPGRREEFLTQLLDIEETARGRPTLVLDELTPAHGQRSAARERTAHCTHRLITTTWTWEAIIREVRVRPHPSVAVALPSEVGPLQARRSYRVEPSVHAPVRIEEIEIPTLDGDARDAAKRCVVLDLGLGGLAINTSIPRAHLDPGTVCRRVVIRLPQGPRIEASAVIRDVKANASGLYRHRAGLEFVALDPESRETLNRYIIEKQRADIRAIKRELL